MGTIKNMTDIMAGISAVLTTYSNGNLPAPGYVTNGGTGRVGFQMDNPAKVEKWAKSVDKMMTVTRYTKNDTPHVLYEVNFRQEFPTLPTLDVNVYCLVYTDE